MENEECNGKNFYLIREKILRDGVKLWLAPYYLDAEGPSQINLQLLAEECSKSLDIAHNVCYESLIQLQNNAIEKLHSRQRFKESGIATLKIKILRQNSSPEIVSEEVLLSNFASDLKNTISSRIQIPVDKFKLIANGKVLKDEEGLHTQGVQNGHLVMVLAVNGSTSADLQEDEKRAQEIEITKADTNLLASDEYYFTVEDQAGNNLSIPPRERKALVTAMTLHEKGRTALKNDDYNRALSFFLDADAEFRECTSQLLQTVDNYALLDLDIAWCYLCLQSFKQLPEAQERLTRCERTLSKTYGPNLERVIALKGTSGNEAVLFLRLHLLQGIVLFHENKRIEALKVLEGVREELENLKVNEDNVALLVELGYSPAEGRLGLRATHGDLNMAVNYINDNRDKRAESRKQALAKRILDREERKLGRCEDGKQYVNSSFLRMLVNMGYHKETARIALQMCNNKISDSVQYIHDNPGPSTSRSQEMLSLIADLIPELEAAGFDYASSKQALELCDGDVMGAANYLLSHPESANRLNMIGLIESSSKTDLPRAIEDRKVRDEAFERLSRDITATEDAHLDFTLHQEEIFLQQYLSWLQD